MQYRPEFVIFGKSMVLYKEPVAELVSFIREQGIRTTVMYDMAHVLGLIGDHFQKPFEEGAEIVTGSTHSCCVSGPMPGPTSSTPHVSSTPDSSTMFCGTQLCVRKFCPLALEKWNPCRASSALISLILQRSIVGLLV